MCISHATGAMSIQHGSGHAASLQCKCKSLPTATALAALIIPPDDPLGPSGVKKGMMCSCGCASTATAVFLVDKMHCREISKGAQVHASTNFWHEWYLYCSRELCQSSGTMKVRNCAKVESVIRNVQAPTTCVVQQCKRLRSGL